MFRFYVSFPLHFSLFQPLPAKYFACFFTFCEMFRFAFIFSLLFFFFKSTASERYKYKRPSYHFCCFSLNLSFAGFYITANAAIVGFFIKTKWLMVVVRSTWQSLKGTPLCDKNVIIVIVSKLKEKTTGKYV